MNEMKSQKRESLLCYILLLHERSLQMSVNIKLLVSCRNLPDIKTKFLNYPTIVVQEHNAKEISNYAASAKYDLQSRYQINEQDSISLLQYVSSRSEGMFLYCRLVIHALKRQPSRAKLELAAKTLPKGLEAAYARNTKDILDLKEPNKEIAISILQLLVCAKERPMVVAIKRIIGIKAGDTKFSPDKFLLTKIEDLFGPLLEVRKGRLYFIRSSAQEFLETKDSKIKIQ